MYIPGLIPRNLAELGEAVPIEVHIDIIHFTCLRKLFSKLGVGSLVHFCSLGSGLLVYFDFCT